jgi:hypothetical protein
VDRKETSDVTPQRRSIGEISHAIYTAFAASIDFLLQHSFILDSGSSIHVCHDLNRFSNFRRAPRGHYAVCGSGSVTIQGYGEVDVVLTNQKGRKRSLRLYHVAYCPDFPTNLVSLRLLEARGVDWNHRSGQLTLQNDPDVLGLTRRIHNQYVMEYNNTETPSQGHSVLATTASTPNRYSRQSRKPRQPAWANADLWHKRMGHLGPAALAQLGSRTLGVKLRGPSTAKCTHCALAKITRQISRRPDPNKATRPFYRVHLDWFDLEEGWDGYQHDGRTVRRVLLLTCEATGMILAYFTTCPKENENLPIVRDAINWLHLRYNLGVKIVRSDGEMDRIQTKAWLKTRGIDFEKCAPDTHEQNGVAERTGRLIMEKARAMRLSGHLPHALWREIVATAVYLHNRTPRYSIGWKSPFEAFHEVVMTAEGVTGPRKPILHHLKAYGCRCYALIKSSKDPDRIQKLKKLQPRAHIGYLIGYESTNIYRIWIPHKKKVISARDVLFDEDEFYDGKPLRFTAELISELDEAIEMVEVTPDANMEDLQLRNDDVIDEAEAEDNSQEQLPEDLNEQENVDDEEPEAEKELAQDPAAAYPTPDPSVMNLLTSIDISLPVKSEGVRPTSFATSFAVSTEMLADLPDIPDIEPAIIHELERQQQERFFDFHQYRVPQAWQTSFQAGKLHKKDCPPAPKNYRDLQGHRFEKQFRDEMEKHINEHVNIFKSWSVVDKTEAKGHQILGCQWVFTYKTDKHNRLMKCKARLVVCGNQQKECDLPTRATTLATTSLRALLAIVAKFDLETVQLDAVNAFVHAEIDELVYMRLPPAFGQPNKVLRLNKALYGLRRSPILWQMKFTSALQNLGFSEVPQEPCVMIKGGIICFFYVDDIVFAFRKQDTANLTQMISILKKQFTMKELGEVKWFLGIHIFRDRSKRSLWLSQNAYIEKIANELISNLDPSSCPRTPMTDEELLPLPAEEEVKDTERTLYQRKIGSILYAAISTRPDIAFAAARLSRFNQRPGQAHQAAADRVLQYLYRTRHLCICYGNQSTATSLICASDASFADNTLDRKSSQGYILKLFGGPIAWRANKQDTVTTSSTEAELLALSQTAKETIYISRLLTALSLELDEPLTIECDNRQTIRLLVEESMKLQTKLRHVDIHSHWLRQEVQRGAITITWQETQKMMADGLTKALSRAVFQRFTEMIGLEDQEKRLRLIRCEEDLKERLQGLEEESFAYTRDLRYGP